MAENWCQPALFSRVEARKTLQCEGCGTRVESKRNPETWVMIGRSRIRIPKTGRSAILACWCLLCYRQVLKSKLNPWVNPTDAEVREIRRRLMI
jgi:hypothetical protein